MQKQLAIKIVLIIVIGLTLIVPISMVKSKVYERQTYQTQAENAVANSWTGPQTIMTPVLVVPYQLSTKSNSGFYTAESLKGLEQSRVIIPVSLTSSGSIKNNSVFKGIYEVQVYNARFMSEGAIPKHLINEKIAEIKNLSNFESFDVPYLSVHISDMRGISTVPKLDINDLKVKLMPGSELQGLGDGFHAKIPSLINNTQDIHFTLELSLRGMGSFSFIQIADEATSKLTSDWPHPEFIGATLPNERSISNEGFDASWSSTRYSSNSFDRLNQCMATSKCYDFLAGASGVNFIDPVDVYLQSERSIKYAMLFIGLSFITFFLFEHIKKIRIHPIQYGFVGLAIAIFYLLLISLAEHISFGTAYLISMLSCSGLMLFYTRHMLNSFSSSALFTGMMVVLYGVLYVIVQAEDFAQLMGAALIFFLLSVLMITTRKLDWYHLEVGDRAP